LGSFASSQTEPYSRKRGLRVCSCPRGSSPLSTLSALCQLQRRPLC
jgi:hypothetical protein